SWLVLTLVGCTAPFFSDQIFDMMYQVLMSPGSSGFGSLVSKSTVRSSTLRTSFTVVSLPLMSEPSISTRLYENTTSSAVKGEPSWNFTFGRSLNRHTVGDVCCHEVASLGTSSSFLPRPTSGS